MLKILKGIGKNKATGLDDVPAKFIVDGSAEIACPLTHIINLSIYHSKVPKDLKSAKVVPLYKKNSKTDVGNYRPVSILPVVSKILERVIYTQLEGYLSQNDLLYQFQSGFRTGFSTDSCLVHLTDYIRLEMDKGNYTGMVLLDLQKAFDTVNHSILLMKMRALGLSGSAVCWFTSYLTERTQCVSVNNSLSSPSETVCGVPQGSILGPLLFLVYVNDMERAVRCKLLLYADDSALLVSGRSVKEIETELSSELSNVRTWLIDNKLSLHLGKTQSILFGTQKRIRKKSTMSVTCGDTAISAKQTVEYLGSQMGQTVDGQEMYYRTHATAHSRLKFLYRQGKLLNVRTRRILVSALVQPFFDYACSSWYYGLKKKNALRLQTCQNKLIRFVLGLDPGAHVGLAEFRQVGWLPVEKRVRQTSIHLMYKILNGQAPPYLSPGVMRTSDRHRYFTRGSMFGVVVPNVQSHGLKTFLFKAIKYWNELPASIQSLPTITRFKVALKGHLYNTV